MDWHVFVMQAALTVPSLCGILEGGRELSTSCMVTATRSPLWSTADSMPGTAGSTGMPGTAGSIPGTAGSMPGTAGSMPGTAGNRKDTAGSRTGTGGSTPSTARNRTSGLLSNFIWCGLGCVRPLLWPEWKLFSKRNDYWSFNDYRYGTGTYRH